MNKEQISISEIFESIQGETGFAGHMTSFVRTAGCPLRCTWCDSRYSFEPGKRMTIDEIIDTIRNFGWKHICVTGGEPLAQPATISLLHALTAQQYVVSLETNGAISTIDVPPIVHTILDIKCPGSGMDHKNVFSNIERLRRHDEVKFVLVDRADFNWAHAIIKQYNLTHKVGNILLSPAWGLVDPKEIISWMKEVRSQARLNLQIHKYVWSPETRGV